MKKINLVLMLAALFIGLASFAQKKAMPEKDNLLFLLRQGEHIGQALKTIETLQAGNEPGIQPGDVVIIVCGEAVVGLTSEEARSWIERAQKLNHVSIVACGLSLEKFKKTAADLMPGIDYTKNGFIKAFELQKLGYLSVEL